MVCWIKIKSLFQFLISLTSYVTNKSLHVDLGINTLIDPVERAANCIRSPCQVSLTKLLLQLLFFLKVRAYLKVLVLLSNHITGYQSHSAEQTSLLIVVLLQILFVLIKVWLVNCSSFNCVDHLLGFQPFNLFFSRLKFLLEVRVVIEHVIVKLIACQFDALLKCFVDNGNLFVVDLLLLLKF